MSWLIFANAKYDKPNNMKNSNEGKASRTEAQKVDPEVDEKRKRRLEIQKDVLKKIMSPIAEQLEEQKLKEAAHKSRKK